MMILYKSIILNQVLGPTKLGYTSLFQNRKRSRTVNNYTVAYFVIVS